MKKYLLLLPILATGLSVYGMKDGVELTAFEPTRNRWDTQNRHVMNNLDEIMQYSDEMPILAHGNRKDVRPQMAKLFSALNAKIVYDGQGAHLSPELSEYVTKQAKAEEAFLDSTEYMLQARRRTYIRLAVTGLGFLGVGVVAYKLGQSSAK